ncbi:MAG: hypothetical protein A2Y17_01460 [Clostridiales bacterium GWF2_38_85]|nr:MAG: hypothetical protein A2Y17_01460 [Clostridiales bacterium GWF2_38_85]HBL85188.1 hypothetical protein [Clostridiales bacterium]
MELVGAVMICSSCFILGVLAARSEKQTCDRISALLRLVIHIKNTISVTRIPLGEVFGRYNDKILTECGFLGILKYPNSTNDYSVRWQRGIQLMLLPPEISQAAISVGRRLGRLDLKTQLEQLIYLENILAEALKEQRKALEGKQKIYKSVSLLVGVVISILLL